MPRRTLVPTIFAALIAAGIGIYIGLGVIPWFPVQASAQAHNTDRLYYVLVIASVVIFVIVMTAMLYSVWQFRMRPGQELEDGAPIHGNTRLEVVWTVLPTILVLGLLAYSFVVLADNERKPAGKELQVGVTGQQFIWYYHYPTEVTGGKAFDSYQLVLPINQSVQFEMVSRDVIHAFWIPAFRLQEDVVPGITTHYRATPTRIGVYPVVCNLLCGIGHSLMRSTVYVVSQSRFHSWVAAQERAVAAGHGVSVPAGSPPASARRRRRPRSRTPWARAPSRPRRGPSGPRAVPRDEGDGAGGGRDYLAGVTFKHAAGSVPAADEPRRAPCRRQN